MSSKLLRKCLYLFQRQTGIFFEEEKFFPILEKRIHQLLTTPIQYLSLLQTKEVEKEIEILAPEFTVGETYFFRDIGQLNDLIDQGRKILKKNHINHLQIWSAGCSTGEEAYTLAILLEELKQEGCFFTYHILGTDLDASRIQFAKEGFYSGRSLQKLPPPILEKYFESSNSKYRLKDKIRNNVKFSLFNLAIDSQISIPSIFQKHFEIILCRNVFIYLKRNTVAYVLQKFKKVLSVHGSLFLGHSEASCVENIPFESIRLKESFCFIHPIKKQDSSNKEKTRVTNNIFQISTKIRDRSTFKKQNQKKILSSSSKSLTPRRKLHSSSTTSLVRKSSNLEEAHLLYNLQKYEPANQICLQILKNNSLHKEALFLLSLIALSQKKYFLAIKNLRQLLYLSPENLTSRYHLARVLFKTGELQASKKEYENILKLISQYSLRDILPKSEGMTYEILQKICEKEINNQYI